MAVSPHPSVKPAKPHRPPSDRMGQGKRESGQEGVSYGAKNEFGPGYDHSSEHSSQEYGHSMKSHHIGSGDHKSEFPGTGGSVPKAGDKDY